MQGNTRYRTILLTCGADDWISHVENAIHDDVAKKLAHILLKRQGQSLSRKEAKEELAVGWHTSQSAFQTLKKTGFIDREGKNDPDGRSPGTKLLLTLPSSGFNHNGCDFFTDKTTDTREKVTAGGETPAKSRLTAEVQVIVTDHETGETTRTNTVYALPSPDLQGVEERCGRTVKKPHIAWGFLPQKISTYTEYIIGIGPENINDTDSGGISTDQKSNIQSMAKPYVDSSTQEAPQDDQPSGHDHNGSEQAGASAEKSERRKKISQGLQESMEAKIGTHQRKSKRPDQPKPSEKPKKEVRVAKKHQPIVDRWEQIVGTGHGRHTDRFKMSIKRLKEALDGTLYQQLESAPAEYKGRAFTEEEIMMTLDRFEKRRNLLDYEPSAKEWLQRLSLGDFFLNKYSKRSDGYTSEFIYCLENEPEKYDPDKKKQDRARTEVDEETRVEFARAYNLLCKNTQDFEKLGPEGSTLLSLARRYHNLHKSLLSYYHERSVFMEAENAGTRGKGSPEAKLFVKMMDFLDERFGEKKWGVGHLMGRKTVAMFIGSLYNSGQIVDIPADQLDVIQMECNGFKLGGEYSDGDDELYT